MPSRRPLPAPAPPLPAPMPARGEILRVWLGLGMQSFGGGAATLALIRRVVVERRGWLSDAEFGRDWALCQIAPGINLVGLTILIGRRLGGAWGIALSLLGLLGPSAGVTVVLTALFLHWQHNVLVRHAVQGVVPATVGLGLLTAGQMAASGLAAARREGRFSLATALALLAGGAVCAAGARVPTLAILCGAGAVGALTHWSRERRRTAVQGNRERRRTARGRVRR